MYCALLKSKVSPFMVTLRSAWAWYSGGGRSLKSIGMLGMEHPAKDIASASTASTAIFMVYLLLIQIYITSVLLSAWRFSTAASGKFSSRRPFPWRGGSSRAWPWLLFGLGS